MGRDFAIRTMPLGYDLLDHIIRLSFTFSTGAVQGCSCRLSSRSLSLSSRGEDVPRVHGRPFRLSREHAISIDRCRSRGTDAGFTVAGETLKKDDQKKSRLDREREEGSLPMRRGAHCSRYNNEMRFVLPRIPRFFPSTSFFSFDVSIILSITKFRSFSQQRKNTR